MVTIAVRAERQTGRCGLGDGGAQQQRQDEDGKRREAHGNVVDPSTRLERFMTTPRAVIVRQRRDASYPSSRR